MLRPPTPGRFSRTHCRLRRRDRHAGLTLGSRAQTFDRCAPVADRPAVSQRPVESHATAQADRLAGVCLRCLVLGGVRTRGNLPDALGRRTVGLRVVATDRAGGRGGHAGRGGQLPAERACLPVGRGRLRGGHHQSGRHRRSGRGQRADGGLRSHRCGFDGIGDVEHRLGAPRRGRQQGVVLCGCHPAGDGHESARGARIRAGLRDPDVRASSSAWRA